MDYSGFMTHKLGQKYVKVFQNFFFSEKTGGSSVV